MSDELLERMDREIEHLTAENERLRDFIEGVRLLGKTELKVSGILLEDLCAEALQDKDRDNDSV